MRAKDLKKIKAVFVLLEEEQSGYLILIPPYSDVWSPFIKNLIHFGGQNVPLEKENLKPTRGLGFKC